MKETFTPTEDRSGRDDLFDAYQVASRDAAFMADMRGVAKDFKRAVADGLQDDRGEEAPRLPV